MLIFLAAEHGVAAGFHPALASQLDQQAHGLVGDPVLGIVQIQARGFGGEPCPTLWVIGEQLPQLGVLDFFVVVLKRFPG
jgi:hypothetical protein